MERTVAYLLRCPWSLVPKAMQVCKSSDKESKDARKQKRQQSTSNDGDGRCNGNSDGRHNGNMIATAATATAMEGMMATATEMTTLVDTTRKQQWKV